MEILFGLMLAAGTVLVLLAAPIVSWARAARLAVDLRQLQARLAGLESEVRDLRARVAAGVPSSASTGAPSSIGETAGPVPADASRSRDVHPAKESLEEPASAAVLPEPAQVLAASPVPAADTIADEDETDARAHTVLPPLPPEPATLATDQGSLEAAIGGRLLLYIGTVALVLGVAFFLKYAFDRNWITEWMRVVLGA